MPHEEHDESESEDEVGGHAPNQALPIANLPFSFDGVPQDGMEYLFTVRRDSRRLPRYTRVDVPSVATGGTTTDVKPPASKTLHRSFPSERWRIEYGRNFANYRLNLRRAIKAGPVIQLPLPSWQSRNDWWKYITGSTTSEAHEPTLSLLKQFTTRNTTGLLYWFSVWLTEYVDTLEEAPKEQGDEEGDEEVTTPRRIDAIHYRWMFALLGLLDTELVGSDISTLRVLARAAIRLVQVLSTIEGTNGVDRVEGRTPSTVAGCWMVVGAIVGVWGQRDIWDEARDALSL